MTSLIWVGFIAFVLVMLALDLLVVNRGAHVISAKKALGWTGFFICLALGFNVLVYFMYEHHLLGIGKHVGSATSGKDAAIEFFTGWLLEYSLSLDNVFVIALIFRHFAVPKKYQHRVLFWGILGALVMRGIMIAVGAALIHRFHWMIYVFGGLLLLTAVRLMFTGEKEPEPESGLVFRTARRLLPVAFPPQRQGAEPLLDPPSGPHEHMTVGAQDPPGDDALTAAHSGKDTGFGDRFFVRIGGKLMVTPLFLVLLVVETTDVIFAVDSIPAIFGVTEDPFLVFTSNVFAILGLRSLYFALAAIMDKFRYLKTALVFVLAFVGIKMLLPLFGVEKISTELSLAIIGGILGLGVAASMFASRRERLRRPAPIDDLTEAAEEAWRRSRRVVIFVIGITIVGLSIPIGLLPGPGGIAVAIGGLALLATEFVWARNLLKFARKRAAGMAHQFLGEKPPRPLLVIPVALVGISLLAVLLFFKPHHAKLIWYASIGPALAVCLWAGWSLYRWFHLRELTEKPSKPSTPDADPNA